MRYRRADGFALVAVLWIMVMLGVVGVSLQVGARATRRAVANARVEARARWAGRAALAHTLHQLDGMLRQGGAAFTLQAAGDTVLRPTTLKFDDVTAAALVLDARARLNLNLADDGQLTALFESAGIERGNALAAAVLDWRDVDGLRRPGGAEAAAYAALRPPSRPKNGPFYAVSELRTVRGVTPSAYARIAPHVTVFGDGRVNVNSAPVPVLVTLPGIDRVAARQIVARQRGTPFRNEFELLASLPRRARDRIQSDLGSFVDRITFNARDIEIHVTVRVGDSAAATRLHALVELTGSTVWRVVRVVES